jgi:ribosomal protein L32E
MYVRWNRRKRIKEGWRKKKGDYLSAVLVESCRIDGKPRQKTIKHLGSIGEDRLDRVYDRKCFWDKAERNMDSLNLQPDNRHKVIVGLEKIVPKPSDADIAKDLEERKRSLKEIEERLSRGLR